MSENIRNSPSSHANDHCMEKMRGNDGKLYMSLPNKNMVCRWVKVSDKIINTDELYYKAVERLGNKWPEFEKKLKLFKKSSSDTSRKVRKTSRKARKTSRKARKTSRKARKTSRKARKTSRKTSRKTRK